MKDEKDKDLDKLFQSEFQHPYNNDGYVEDDWNKLEAMLDKRDKRRFIVYLRPLITVAAALLLLLLGWWLFTPITESRQHAIARTEVKSTKSNSNTIIATINKQPINSLKQAPYNTAHTIKPKTPAVHHNMPMLANKTINDNIDHSENGYPTTSQKELNKTILVAFNPGLQINTEEPIIPGLPADGQNAVAMISPASGNNRANGHKVTVKRNNSFKPIYAISVVGAPDLNSVGSFQQSKVGTNLGLEFSAGISKKFTISTGALYSVKPYITGFANFHSTSYAFAVDPLNVSANCRMLDIPLNINYLVYNKHLQKLSFGTGLSSYIMLQENYRFNYANNTIAGPRYYDVPNSNKYFFGVVNLNATYERRLSSKVGLTVQPYFKLPITNLGYSQVRLQSSGVAFGVSYNLNSFKKPD